MNERPVHRAEQDIALRFDRVSFSFGAVRVLENASFHIHQGEFVALTGPNGSGKTTALKLLLGLEIPDSGAIEVFGSSTLRQERIGYVPQQAQQDRAFPITVKEVVKTGCLCPLARFADPEDTAAVEEALRQAEILDLASRPYSALSGGQRRRVLVARALASLLKREYRSGLSAKEPGLLVLDEPTANMDEESEGRLFKTLGKLKGNTTILIVTHDRDFISSLVDRVLCVGKGGHGASGPGNNFTVVQHRLEASSETWREEFRILHEESFPGDFCYPVGAPDPVCSIGPVEKGHKEEPR